MKRSDDERAAAKHKIRTKVFEYACAHGIAALTLGNLAAHLGMSKSTLVAHFGSKERLLLFVLDEMRARFEDVVLRPCEGRQKLARAATLLEGHVAFSISAEGRLLECILLQEGLLAGVRRGAQEVERLFLRELADCLRASGAPDSDEDLEARVFEARGIVSAAAKAAVHDAVDADRRARSAVWRWLTPARRRPTDAT